jgi:site-specific DNA recombinase
MERIHLFQKFITKKNQEVIENRNIVGYTRISSKQQADNFSLAEQDDEIRNFARKNNYNLIQIFGGTYESASGDFTRKEFKHLYDRVTQSHPKPFAIAIKFINRFSRTGADAITIVQDLVENKNIHLIETSSGLSTEHIKERYEIYDKLLKAQVENQERLERTMPGMKKFLEAGNWLGKAPLGYTMKGTRVTDYALKNYKQEIFINDKGELLKKAWKWKIEGERDVYIRQRLKEMGLIITKQKLSDIWRKPFYAGINTNSLLDSPVKGNWEPMVSEEDFLRLSAIISEPKKVPYASEAIHIERPLARFLKCGNCGSLLTGYEVKKKKIHYYKCNSCKGATFNANTVGKSRKEGLNSTFSKLLQGYELRCDLIEPFKLQLKKFFEFNHQDTIENIAILQKEVAESDRKLKALDERFWLSSVDLPAEKYKAFQDQIKQEKAQKENRLAALKNKLSNSEFCIEEAIQIAQNLQYYWDSSDLETKLKLQKTVFPEGLPIVPSNRRYLTKNVNHFFLRTLRFSRYYVISKNGKSRQSDGFFPLVAGENEISNFLEGYKMVVDLWVYMNRPDE